MYIYCVGRTRLHVVSGIADDVLEAACSGLYAVLFGILCEELDFLLLVDSHCVVTPLGEVAVESLVDGLRVDLELLCVVAVAVVALCLEEVDDTLLYESIVQVFSEIVTFDE